MLHAKTIRILRWIAIGVWVPTILSCAGAPKTETKGIPTSDRENPGTSFDQVMGVLKSNPYSPAQLPLSHTTLGDIRSEQLRLDAGRTLDSPTDIRAPFRRLLHPNGVCLAGEWIIEKANPYSGLFKAGTRFPIIARVSPPNTGVTTRKFHPQSVGFVGKIFPSKDSMAPVKTANFITQTDLGGFISPRSKVLDSHVAFSNAPGVTAINRGDEVAAFGFQGNVLARVDLQTTQRQLYPLAESNKAGEATRTPAYMRLTLDPRLDTPGDGTGADLRLEYFNRVATNSPLAYFITVSDVGRVQGPLFLQRSVIKWDERPIGRIEFHEAVLSEACDNQIHFRHPAWREDVNDPASAVRTRHGTAFGQPLLQDQVILQGEVISPQTVARVFDDLRDVERWPSWSSDGLVRAVKVSEQPGNYAVTFAADGDMVRSSCQLETERDSVIALSCRGTNNSQAHFSEPVDQNVTFLLSKLPDGRTKIDWGLLMRSRNAMKQRDEVERNVQRMIEKRYRTF
jgi:hypothetical protein